MKLKTPQLPRKNHHQEPAPARAAAPAMPIARSNAVSTASPLRKATGGLVAPTRRRNTAAMIAGLAFILVAAAMAASVASSFDDSIEVLVANDSILEGQPVTADHFRTVKIAAGSGDIQALAPESLDDLIGLVAAGPIGQGSLVHPDQFAQALEEQQIVVGAALALNQYPANGLKPGDRVRLIAVSGPFSFGVNDFQTGEEVTVGEVTFVQPTRDGIHVSLRVGESTANVVAELVAQDRIIIGLVDQSIDIDVLPPLTAADPVTPLQLDEESAQ